MQEKKSMLRPIGRVWQWLLVSLAVVILDQLTKWLCATYLKAVGSVDVIPHVLRFTYVENTGAAFGSFSDQRWVFMVLSTVAIVAVTFYLLFFSERSKWLRCALALLIGGGIGNMIDRVVLGFVIDFIDFYLFPFWVWVFNVADVAVCVGVGMFLLFYVLDIVRLAKSNDADAPRDEDATS